jgi:hypothetical protein
LHSQTLLNKELREEQQEKEYEILDLRSPFVESPTRRQCNTMSWDKPTQSLGKIASLISGIEKSVDELYNFDPNTTKSRLLEVRRNHMDYVRRTASEVRLLHCTLYLAVRLSDEYK